MRNPVRDATVKDFTPVDFIFADRYNNKKHAKTVAFQEQTLLHHEMHFVGQCKGHLSHILCMKGYRHFPPEIKSLPYIFKAKLCTVCQVHA